MATMAVNVRMEEDLKAQMDETAASIGLTTAAAFNVFARQFVAHGGFPFEVVVPVPTERSFAREMDRRFEEVLSGGGSVHELVGDSDD